VLTCAHVGYTETDDDYHRTVDAESYLNTLLEIDDVDLFAGADYIALDDGRDFLAEDLQYDAVILHHLYQHPGQGHAGVHGTSSLHTPQQWRERLAACGARFILAYGGSTEVSGGYLEDIPGYTMLCYDDRKAVYLKN
jgi:hypothetical protein